MARIIYNDSRDPYVQGDVMVFSDIEEARREVEIDDAENPYVFICDEEGRPCRALAGKIQVIDRADFKRFDMTRIEQMLEVFIRDICREEPGATLDEKLSQIVRYQKTGASVSAMPAGGVLVQGRAILVLLAVAAVALVFLLR